MQKSLRLLAVAFALSLTAATSLHAEQTGCNPHPQVARPSNSALGSFVYTVRSFFGL